MKPPLVWLALIVLGIWPISVHADDLAGSGADIQKIIAALEASDLSANEIRAIDSFVRLDVVDLSAFESSDDYQALETALRGTEDGWAMVQTAIVSNDAIEEELTRRSVAIRRVVAATRDPTNAIAIYIR